MTDAQTSAVSVDTPADLDAVTAALDIAQAVVDAGVAQLASRGVDENQVLAYDVAHAAAAVQCGKGLLQYGAKGSAESHVTAAFVADALAEDEGVDVSADLLEG